MQGTEAKPRNDPNTTRLVPPTLAKPESKEDRAPTEILRPSNCGVSRRRPTTSVFASAGRAPRCRRHAPAQQVRRAFVREASFPRSAPRSPFDARRRANPRRAHRRDRTPPFRTGVQDVRPAAASASKGLSEPGTWVVRVYGNDVDVVYGTVESGTGETFCDIQVVGAVVESVPSEKPSGAMTGPRATPSVPSESRLPPLLGRRRRATAP